MMHQSGNRTIRWSPPFCEVYSSVTHTNAEKYGCRQSQIGNIVIPTWSLSIFLQQPPDMRKPPMGRSLFI